MIRRFPLALLAFSTLAAGSAGALDTGFSVSCPADAVPGNTINVNVELRNNEGFPLNVRVISSITGNANGTLGGLGIFGPLVADERTVNAFSTANPVIAAIPALDASLAGTVATYIFIAEWEGAGGEDSTETATCLVNALGL